MNTDRIETLDSLRGIAAMIVVIFHILLSFTIFYEANILNNFANDFLKLFMVTPLHTIWAGREAVLLFFVLSGFVLSLSIYSSKRKSYFSYLVKRFFRIYVPYIVIMLLSVLLVSFFAEFKDLAGLSKTYDARWNHEVSMTAIIHYVLMINYDSANVNGVVWTLFHEMRISVFFPLFVIIIMRFKFMKMLVLAFGLNWIFYETSDVLSVVLQDHVTGIFFYQLTDSFYYCTFFIMGAILAKYRGNLTKLKAQSPVIKAGLFMLALVLINCRWLREFDVTNPMITEMVSAFGILLLLIVVLTSDLSHSILTKKPLIWLGKVSFSLYLIHIPVLMLMTIFLSDFMPIWLTFALVPVVSLPLAHLTYVFLEVPAMNLGRKFSRKVGPKVKVAKVEKVA